MTNPYSELPPEAYWRTGVAEKNPFEIAALWNPKFRLTPQGRTSTLGSCFAQHIGRTLKSSKYNWFDAEPAPDLCPHELAKKFNYGIFSARTGNIYTAAALQQWVQWAVAPETAPGEVWTKGGRFFDPFRPAIEPDGFASTEELIRSRAVTLDAIRDIVDTSSTLVFTLGLTEAWVSKEHGFTYAVCPGTVAGEFDSNIHAFTNYGFQQIFNQLMQTIRLLRSRNPRIQVLLTVSPVPLTATASGEHVLTATSYSKSVLRAVAGALSSRFTFVDYFPSYEIITAFPFRGMFFAPNLRSVSPFGVDFVMRTFLTAQKEKFGEVAPVDEIEAPVKRPEFRDDIVCEEQMLDAFARA